MQENSRLQGGTIMSVRQNKPQDNKGDKKKFFRSVLRGLKEEGQKGAAKAAKNILSKSPPDSGGKVEDQNSKKESAPPE